MAIASLAALVSKGPTALNGSATLAWISEDAPSVDAAMTNALVQKSVQFQVTNG